MEKRKAENAERERQLAEFAKYEEARKARLVVIRADEARRAEEPRKAEEAQLAEIAARVAVERKEAERLADISR